MVSEILLGDVFLLGCGNLKRSELDQGNIF